ncbi:hypothetical protein L1987_57552 [Smallanthus sonchifolius]|uniref:Uncharacterized protein n=1 Tax=Smallanthus sonchifolius TaxID=185202 RepID=A0ACB9DDD1_9ASTR|nr:hypothetical protein L1987_57552 [Smallanthus sonchifolius]
MPHVICSDISRLIPLRSSCGIQVKSLRNRARELSPRKLSKKSEKITPSRYAKEEKKCFAVRERFQIRARLHCPAWYAKNQETFLAIREGLKFRKTLDFDIK